MSARGAGRPGVPAVRTAHRGTGVGGGPEGDGTVHAVPGFTLIATANLRDRGVSEMSAALKRRFNFETVGPIDDLDAETELVRGQATAALARSGARFSVDDAVLEALVTAFRDLRLAAARRAGRSSGPPR